MMTFAEYRSVLEDLANQGVCSQRVDRLTAGVHGGLFIKHDVEARIELALRMAEIERQTGHMATYYFQGDFLDHAAGREIIQRIAALGHEVAYHYDVLDAADGDYAKAEAQFRDYLERFAAIGCPIVTVCPHGNPTKVRRGWNSNKDFFRNAAVRRAFPDLLDIVMDFPRLFGRGAYISDAGYRLRIIGEIAGNDRTNDVAMQDGQQVAWTEIGPMTARHDGVVLSVHPHRFMDSRLKAAMQKGVFTVMKQTYLVLRRVPLVSGLVSRFYKLSRRV